MPLDKPTRRLLLILGASCATASVAAAQSAEAPLDKSRYHLFNPTPPQHLRELAADRPDITESPRTVDAGHLQLEISFVDFVYDNEAGVRTRTFTVAPFNLKLGLLNNVDLQLVGDPYIESRINTDAGRETLSGFGDTTLRLKINLWGNDDGQTAFGLMPFITFPTGGSDITANRVQGGLIIPFETELPGGFSLGLMGEFDILWNQEDRDYDVEFLHTVAVGRDIIGRLAGYVEYIGIAPFQGNMDYQVLIGTGLTYLINQNTQLDAGVIFGLTDEAPDYNLFVGMTIRI